MKFEINSGNDSIGAFIEAIPTELDGFPLIQKLLLSKSILNVSPDRSAVSAVLAFAPYLSGQQILPSQFSALTAELLQRLMLPGWTHFSPIHPANIPIPRGTREVALRLEDEKPSMLYELRLVPSNGSAGAGYEPESLIVHTNSIDLDCLGSNSSIHISRASLAVAILLAEDLDVATYVISRNTAVKFKLTSDVIELLNAVSIGIRVEDE